MPNHLSTYNLQIEEGTPLWEMIWKPATKRRGFQNIECEETAKFIRRFPSTLQLPAEEEELAMYEFAIETLTDAGYRHYEISNFAKPGFECLHNINYWKNGNYIGLGAGAHSHINGRRWSNPNCIESYIETESRNRYITATETDQRETIFMGLRLLEGLPTEKFIGFEKEVAELIEDGLLIRENNHYRLTRRGLYLGNLVFEKFV
jgi:oxygen-independent coproporphyrinogen-3 oxidase